MHLFDDLGRALRWLRDRRGKKQYEVAQEAGITKGMLCAYETGKQRPSLETLDKILRALDADLVALHEALGLVGRYRSLQVAEATAGQERGAYPLPNAGRDAVSDVPRESLGQVIGGLGSLVRQLHDLLQQFPDSPADPAPPRPPTRRR